ncbi:translation elongation factor Ts [Curvivirga aplysinae]|uniref:translation elongation factor Ts n=1 Tax=Curvivirga aplysinae TaxID=2529852 RepID=UPI0012BB9DFD|nr:translation elongation factor Ts [Curvivirga aplysinae]MTI08769.1 elongation factor Ts [Curvivirga aplysinae]
MAITAALVKELRDKSGAGMMDCKKALSETNGDIDAAVDWLRTKGLSKAAKKSGRVAAEGLVAVISAGTKGAVVEINAETDFVSRNETFQGFVEEVAKIALDKDADQDAIMAADYPGAGRSVQDQLTDNIATIGENQSFRRAKVLSVSNGVVSSYVHSALKPGLGKIGVLVALESDADSAVLEGLGKQIAMHVAAARPDFLGKDDVDPEVLDRERQVQIETARESGKPENIIEKMVEGRIRKYYEEICLVEQTFVMDTDKKVGQVVADAAKDAGTDIKLTGFARFELGDGIEKKEDDFAAEVAAMAG